MTRAKPIGLPAGILYDPWVNSVDIRVWCAYRHHAGPDLLTNVTADEIAELLGFNVITVRRAVGRLNRAGYMQRLAGGASSRRRVVEP